MIADRDVLELYLIESTRFTPDRPTYLLELSHWHKTPAKRARDLSLRGRLHPSCACGKPYFCKGVCRPCYFKNYNKTRVRARAA
jgi:hypothetical protein